MELIITCKQCNKIHTIKHDKYRFNYFLSYYFSEGKIISEKEVDSSIFFNSNNILRCYDCKSIYFKIKIIY